MRAKYCVSRVGPYYVRMTTTEAEPQTWVPELTFGARLALVRHRMGWNIKEAAAACGLPAQSWRGWEVQGREPHRLTTIAAIIASRTDCDYLWLVHGPDRGLLASSPEREPVDPLAPRIVAVAGEARKKHARRVHAQRAPIRPLTPALV